MLQENGQWEGGLAKGLVELANTFIVFVRLYFYGALTPVNETTPTPASPGSHYFQMAPSPPLLPIVA